jgi:hypothetical protein
VRLSWAMFLLSLCAAAVFAQSDRGTVTGTVMDPGGAVIANAAIQAKSAATGVVFPTQSTAMGNFTIPQLPVGEYNLPVR